MRPGAAVQEESAVTTAARLPRITRLLALGKGRALLRRSPAPANLTLSAIIIDTLELESRPPADSSCQWRSG